MHIFSHSVVASSSIYALVSDPACNKDVKPNLGLPTRQQIRADGGKSVHAGCRVRHATGRPALPDRAT